MVLKSRTAPCSIDPIQERLKSDGARSGRISDPQVLRALLGRSRQMIGGSVTRASKDTGARAIRSKIPKGKSANVPEPAY